MEFIGHNREKKRKRRRRNLTKKHRDQTKSEVKFFKTKKSTTETTYSNFVIKKKVVVTMEANAFWENYKAAHEWQNRHNSTWWKARCFALEHENHLLKETIRKLVNNRESHKNTTNKYERNHQNIYQNMNFNPADNKDDENVEEHFEFQLNEEMMSFLAQSICHKIDLKNKKNTAALQYEEEMDPRITSPNALCLVRKRSKDAKQLYGKAASRILAMETALQTTIEKHIDKSNPQYWPNIPLKL